MYYFISREVHHNCLNKCNEIRPQDQFDIIYKSCRKSDKLYHIMLYQPKGVIKNKTNKKGYLTCKH